MTNRRLQIPILLSILAAIATIVLKYLAYHVTGSVGLLSDAAESVVNLLAAVTALLSLWYASQPVDENHTYGHEKIEFFSSGLEGILIVVAAITIAWYAVHRLRTPQDLQAIDLGLGLSLVATLINLAAARLLLRVGRNTGSIVLEADGKHLMSDVWSSAAVLVGISLVWLTNVSTLDPLLALLVAGSVAWTGFDLIRRSFNGLMDHALSPEEQTKVRSTIQANLDPAMDFHALRTRQAGARRFADFHLLVPGAQSVQQAHAVATRIEEAVSAALPGIEVTIHIEPIEERASYEDSALVPLEEQLAKAKK